jgi:glucose/arabinose dehydrogenase
MWATDMGRDLLGDDLPPDEINIVEEGKNYGWPTCYGANIHDTDFDKNTYIRAPCSAPFETPSLVDLPAHSAPLGIVFVPATSTWPREYWNNLLVAYHGSWNRSEPTGYKIVRFQLDTNGHFVNVNKSTKVAIAEDFITGWLTKAGALGRPVELVIGPDGALYVSDDKAGVIYKVTPPKKR